MSGTTPSPFGPIAMTAMIAFSSTTSAGPLFLPEVQDSATREDFYQLSAPTASDEKITVEDSTEVSRKKFEKLASEWRRETGMYSLPHMKFSHPAYQTILAMGIEAVPFILEDLRVRPGHWTVALAAITGANPVREGDSLRQATAAWVEWGEAQGYGA